MATAEFTLSELESVLGILGIAAGDTVLVHSSLMHLGLLSGCSPRQMPECIIDAFLDRLGQAGTLAGLAPDYDYSNRGVPFDTRTSPVAREIGVLNAALAARPEAERSANPIFSLAAIGASAKRICVGSNASAFGAESAWDRAVAAGTKIVMLGASFQRFTLARYIEQRFGVPYLYVKLFRTPVFRNGTEVAMPVTALLRYAHLPLEYDLSRFGELLREKEILRETALGGGTVMVADAAAAVDAGIEALNRDIHYFLAKAPAYGETELPLK